MYFTLTEDLNADTKFPLEILYLYLDFIKFAVEILDSYTQSFQT